MGLRRRTDFQVLQFVMIALGVLMLSLCVSLMYSEVVSVVANMKLKCCPKKVNFHRDPFGHFVLLDCAFFAKERIDEDLFTSKIMHK